MSNSWPRKTPFLGIGFSAARQLGGRLRVPASALAKRQIKAAASLATLQNRKIQCDAAKPAARAMPRLQR